MKIGISRNTEGIASAAELVRCAADCGFTGIQFKTSQLRAWSFRPEVLDDIHPAARAMARGGVVFHPGADFVKWPDLTNSVLHFAAAAAEHVCYCFCPQPKDGHTYESIARQLLHTGRQYAQHNITFSFHNHTGSMMGSLDECRRLCDLLDPALCGLTFDTAHAAACGIRNLANALSALGSHINNIHLKDINTDGKFCPLGTGRLPLADVVAQLDEAAYARWLIVDEESAGVSCPDACRISIDFIHAHARKS